MSASRRTSLTTYRARARPPAQADGAEEAQRWQDACRERQPAEENEDGGRDHQRRRPEPDRAAMGQPGYEPEGHDRQDDEVHEVDDDIVERRLHVSGVRQEVDVQAEGHRDDEEAEGEPRQAIEAGSHGQATGAHVRATVSATIRRIAVANGAGPEAGGRSREGRRVEGCRARPEHALSEGLDARRSYEEAAPPVVHDLAGAAAGKREGRPPRGLDLGNRQAEVLDAGHDQGLAGRHRPGDRRVRQAAQEADRGTGAPAQPAEVRPAADDVERQARSAGSRDRDVEALCTAEAERRPGTAPALGRGLEPLEGDRRVDDLGRRAVDGGQAGRGVRRVGDDPVDPPEGGPVEPPEPGERRAESCWPRCWRKYSSDCQMKRAGVWT